LILNKIHRLNQRCWGDVVWKNLEVTLMKLARSSLGCWFKQLDW